MPPAKEYLDFLQKHNAANVIILSICTGALVVAHAGITKGKVVTAPRFLIPDLRKNFPDVKIWDDTVRVTKDGNLWMCGKQVLAISFKSRSLTSNSVKL
jgi:transcriptional regulator GlxA family with amidase domain